MPESASLSESRRSRLVGPDNSHHPELSILELLSLKSDIESRGVYSTILWEDLPLHGRMGWTVGHFDTWHYVFGSTDLGRLKSLMLGMLELTKQNGEERRARLGVKPLSAALPDENVQQEKMTNVSQVGLGAPRDAEETANSNRVIYRMGTEDLLAAN